jgi:hypothetical protein
MSPFKLLGKKLSFSSFSRTIIAHLHQQSIVALQFCRKRFFGFCSKTLIVGVQALALFLSG